jgi:two-component system response regulator FixJ
MNGFGRPIAICFEDVDSGRGLGGKFLNKHLPVIFTESGPALIDLIDKLRISCAILDVAPGGKPDFGLLKASSGNLKDIPIFACTPVGSIGIAVEAMKNGAADFLEWPVDVESFVARFEQQNSVANPVKAPLKPKANIKASRSDLKILTGREHEVLSYLARGKSSRETALSLGISPRTVEVHRARIKDKLHVRRSIDLVRMVYDDEFVRDGRE